MAALVEFAKSQIELELPPKGGSGRLRDHLEQVAATTGVLDPRLADQPELPAPAAHIWAWFVDLAHSRSAGIGGPSALSYAEIHAWAETTRTAPTPFEVEALRHLDRIWLAAIGHH